MLLLQTQFASTKAYLNDAYTREKKVRKLKKIMQLRNCFKKTTFLYLEF